MTRFRFARAGALTIFAERLWRACIDLECQPLLEPPSGSPSLGPLPSVRGRTAALGPSAGKPRRQRPLDLVQPLRVCLQDSSAEAVVEQQVLGAAGDGAGGSLGRVELGGELGDLPPQGSEAVEDRLLSDEVGGEQADDGLVLNSREAGGLVHPRGERRAALVGQRVVRARPGAARLLARAQQAQPREPLGLRVPLALGGLPVDPARPCHSDEIVRARPTPADKRQDDVREGGERVG